MRSPSTTTESRPHSPPLEKGQRSKSKIKVLKENTKNKTLAEGSRGQSIYLNRTHPRSRSSRVGRRRRGPGTAAPVPARRQILAEWSPRRASDPPQDSCTSAYPARYTSRRHRVPKIPTREPISPNVYWVHRKSLAVDAGRTAQARSSRTKLPLFWCFIGSVL